MSVTVRSRLQHPWGEYVEEGSRETGLGAVPGLVIVGYLEQIALPRWGLAAMTAKMDTGADTSALHVEGLELLSATRVAFRVAGDAGACGRLVQARIERRGRIRSSNGDEEERLFVRTLLRLGGRSRTVEIGLVDRSRMQQRVLLGRSALEGLFLVDPARPYVVSEEQDGRGG